MRFPGALQQQTSDPRTHQLGPIRMLITGLRDPCPGDNLVVSVSKPL